jgi:hypothetical protein
VGVFLYATQFQTRKQPCAGRTQSCFGPAALVETVSLPNVMRVRSASSTNHLAAHGISPPPHPRLPYPA